MVPAAAEALEDAACFIFTDDAIAVTAAAGPGYTVEGTTLTISAAGTYQVSGQCADGAIQIKKGVAGVTPVSYTHLDVYKRQVADCTISRQCVFAF